MSKKGKKYQEVAKLVDHAKIYTLDEAVELLPKLRTAKFDETIEVCMKLNVDPKQADQNVRGVMTLPAGTGKTVRVAVFTKGDKTADAQEAGADFVGGEELGEKIKGGWLDFDVAIATPDMMATLGKVARVLGPRGLMPNPKAGTVTLEVGKAVREFKAGKIEFRVDKVGTCTVHLVSRVLLPLPSRRTSCLFLKRSRELVLPRLRGLTSARHICLSLIHISE